MKLRNLIVCVTLPLLVVAFGLVKIADTVTPG
jgi:hypothetical protein